MNVQFIELKENHLPEIQSIYNWYVQNSTATFHIEPVEIEKLREFIYIKHPLYQSFVIHFNNEMAGYCYLTNHKPSRPIIARQKSLFI